MPDSFIPQRSEAVPRQFMPTVLIAALDAARRQAAAPPPPAPPEAEPIEPLLEEARRGGWEDGLAEGLRRAAATQEAEATRAAAIAVEALRMGEAAAREAATTVAQDVARLVLSVLDAALPGLAAEHAAPLAAAFARRVAPVLEVAPEACLRVPAGLAEPVRALLGAMAITVEEDAALSPGDARAIWRSGGAAFDLGERRQAIRHVLEAAGLGPKE
ncbi:hypothetical protein KPL78_11915 [Roseomonas sp. HJA6]|uniref:Flagellar assembly protein FliH/Type III secretion system HrpE domain-containing protein n=1 Tax=Roseomonas alba TaxID=2846776 RepID=A0ABS7A8D6_9PROT|nr:hypothetical protein [Neoroseomonas alba]MBW6398560.1 hypothetical protein [Neoroseomonas alba]